jgi:hypothetical protein
MKNIRTFNEFLTESEHQMMSEDKIRQALAESGKMTVRDMMAYMKRMHAGKYDVKLAKKNAKELVADMKGYV